VHDLLTGQAGQDLLEIMSTYQWDDGGAQAAKLFEWIAPDAVSPDPAVATRADEAAHAVATFLANRGSNLLDIGTGWFGRDHKTMGALNPDLVRSFATALIPFQGAMVCDDRDTKGFGLLTTPCEAAVLAARPVFAVLNTDPQAATSFADAAYARMDRYVQLFAENDPTSMSNPFPSALSYVGRLLGLVTVGAMRSDVTPPDVEHELTQARYTIAKAVLARNPGLRFPSEYLQNGVLMSPAEIRQNLGLDKLDDYAIDLTTFLTSNGNIEQLISHNLRGQYELVAGSSAKGAAK
jgi:hypothetical protein